MPPMFPGGVASSGPPASSSSGLLEGVRAGDGAAWQRLAQLYAPLVYHWCRRRGLQASDAEDLVQEVFRVVIARIADFRRDRRGHTFRGWLWGFTRNKLGDWIRHQKPRESAGASQRLLENLPAHEPDDSGQTDAIGSLYQRAVDSIRPDFSERTWQAFWRVVIEDQSADAVARDLAMTRNAVYVAKSRILRRLRETLGET